MSTNSFSAAVRPPAPLRRHQADMLQAPSGEEAQYHIKFVDPLFQIATHIVQTRLPASGPIQPTYKEKLLLYSFFKQAVSGDVQRVCSRPGIFDMLGRAKWDAWKKLEGLQSVDAKQLYVKILLKMLKKHAEIPQARILIDEIEGFTPSVARSDLSSTGSASSHPRSRSPRDEVEPIDEEDALVSRLNNAVQDSPFKNVRRAPSRLGPYVTRAQLPDPVNVSPVPQVICDTTHSSTPTLPENFGTSAPHEERWCQRPLNHFPAEAKAASRDRASLAEAGSPEDTRRLSQLQLAALISRPIRSDEFDYQRSPAIPASRPPSVMTRDATGSVPEVMPERARSEHITVADDRCSSAHSSALLPVAASAVQRHSNHSPSNLHPRWRDLVRTIDHLQATVLALQARLEKLESSAAPPPPPFPGLAPSNRRDPRLRWTIVKRWLKFAGGPFASSLSHLFLFWTFMWISRIIGFLSWKALKLIVGRPRYRERLE